jgi:transposase
MDVVGIDVSKADFHACLLQGEKRAKKSFPNSASGYRQLLTWLRNRKCLDVHVCMEATGAYWMGLAQAVHSSGACVSVVNPSRTALFARSQLRRTKTDVVDAAMLAEFCSTQRPSLWTPPAPEILELRGLLAYRDHVVSEQIRFKQIAKGLHLTQKLERLHDEQLETLAEMLDEIEEQIRDVVQSHRAMQDAFNALTAVKGIGFVTAVALVAKLPASRLRDGKAAAAYAGLAPSERQSGTSVRGKARICKIGNSSLRRDLYMPAIAAIRFNPILASFAERLRENGKPPKVIIAAVMRKLVVLAFHLIKDATADAPIAA